MRSENCDFRNKRKFSNEGMTEETGRRRRRRRRRRRGGGGGGQARVFFVNQSENWNHSSSTIIFTNIEKKNKTNANESNGKRTQRKEKVQKATIEFQCKFAYKKIRTNQNIGMNLVLTNQRRGT